MSKRLTERAGNGKPYFDGCLHCDLESDCGLCPYWEGGLNRLAELEDKIEKGTLIELPCKVGDTVYVIIKAENGYALLKDICDGFMFKDSEVYIGLQTYNVGANKYYFTREDAEKRLEELQNG